ncbi:MAG: thiamine-phosphate kinase [Bacillota bacterium]
MRLADVGESGLVERLLGRLARGPGVVRGPGDDAAVLDLGGKELLLFTVDTLVEEVHFSRAYGSMRDLGAKAMAVNLSDVAAMGGRPVYAVVSLAAPAETAVADIDDLYAGLAGTAARYGVTLVGGDTVRHPHGLVITVALLGLAGRERVLYRKGAVSGDLFYVTGSLGASAAGLFLFQNPHPACPPEVEDRLKKAHLSPEPRVVAGGLLAASGVVSAAEDISDGLALTVAHICTAGGVGARLLADRVPLSPEVRRLGILTGKDPLEWALFGGEDYELLFTVRPGAAAGLEREMAAAGWPVTWIGEVLGPGEGLWLEDAAGAGRPLVPGGYDAFGTEP